MSLQDNKNYIDKEVSEALDQAKRSDTVSVIAVTKYVENDTVSELLKTGIHHIGENRVDKFLNKYQVFKDKDITWHLIGTLQRRKVKEVINFVDYFHALDSVKLAAEIQKRAEHPIKCFLQVNISNEESKHGFLYHEIDDVIEELKQFDKIELVGLMTMAPVNASNSELDHIFARMNQLKQRLQAKKIPRMPFTELSMGMSRDFKIAICNGATFIRVGTVFFK